MKNTRPYMKWVCLCLCAFFLLASAAAKLCAQPVLQGYTIKNGRMYIELDKRTRESMLDSFIAQYDLADLALKYFVRTGKTDSLKDQGWNIDVNNETGFIISKSLMALDNINDPVDKIIFTGKPPENEAIFPAVNNGILFGYNRFKNKNDFAVSDSTVHFFLRNNSKASKVMLAGSFNNWLPNALAMTKTDSGWIAEVKLGPGKYWYKFIIDGNWNTDADNILSENDGQGNINSVFYKANHVFVLDGFGNAKKVYLAGSFNNWNEKQLQMKRSGNGWELPLYLANGTHTYKFIVDGKWTSDITNPETLPDGHGGFNSVVRLGKSFLFKLSDFANAKKVFVAGSFNRWREDELQMNKTNTGWELPYVLGPGNYEYKFIADGKWVTDPLNRNQNSAGDSYLVIDPNYTFHLKGFDKAKSVYLSGDFNNWDPKAFAMEKKNGEWIFNVHLSAGKHRYKFLVDGQWIIDPDNKLWEQNEYDTKNSVIWIER